MTGTDNEYKKVDLDLDDGKKCCFSFSLEQGYNIIGIYNFMNALHHFFIFITLLFISSIPGVDFSGSYTAWMGLKILMVFALCYFWRKGFLARS